MLYPNFINKNDTIGITAPSCGITDKPRQYRLDNAIRKLSNLGYKIKETDNVRKNIKGCSSSPKERAKQLESLYLDNDVKLIICASGGDFLMEMLPYLNYDTIVKHIKWIQGYSDPTGLLFTITTNYDIATIYGSTIGSFGMKKWHISLNNNLEILKGNMIIQESFNRYEDKSNPYVIGDESYNLTKKVRWKNLNNEKEINMEGRMIGGCLDVLLNLIGTRFDKTKEFIEKHKDDGIIWYFDNAELSSESIIRAMWQLKENGWFKYTKGIIFGRSNCDHSYYDITFAEAVKKSLEELNLPIIIDADFGHKPPRMTIINGAYTKITSINGRGTMEFILR